MSKSDDKLELKKLTLLAWTDILRAKGMVDVEQANRMKTLIEKSSKRKKETPIHKRKSTIKMLSGTKILGSIFGYS